MNKKSLFVCLIVTGLLSSPLFAGPCCPRPCRPCHRHDRGSSGVRLAADIVTLVGASLNLLRQPVAVPAAAVPVMAQPVCQPVYPVPVPCRPPYRPCRPCRPCPCR